MAVLGLYGLLVALLGCLGSLGCLTAGHILARKNPERARFLASLGRLCLVVAALAFTVCVGVLGWCFLSGDGSLDYVVANRVSSAAGLPGPMAVVGLWAGREGSLLCWAWLIGLLLGILALGTWRRAQPVDNGALAVGAAVLGAFAAVLLMPGAMPFVASAGQAMVTGGGLADGAAAGMNPLLEHWAMAVHPPLQLLSAAAFTIPFAYAIAALVAGDGEGLWVRRCMPFALVAWVCLGLSIGIGALWAFGMYGWGGYWGWDPVQTAGLLPWLAGVALIHSLAMYRGCGQFKRWSLFLACLAFSCVMLGGFTARSGLFASVHSFDGDGPSAVLCADLALLALLGALAGIAVRWKVFAPVPTRDGAVAKPIARKVAFTLGNLLPVALIAVLAFMLFAPLLPEAIPFGGLEFSPAAYDAVVRPAAIAYGLLLALCPFLSLDGGKKGGRRFGPAAIVAAAVSAVALGFLVWAFLVLLLPAYDGAVAEGDAAARTLLAQGPSAYYNGLTLAGFAVAVFLLFSAILAAAAAFRRKGEGVRERLASIGAALCHGALAFLLVGAIGSSCYASEASGSVAYDPAGGWPGEVLRVGSYDLVYDGTSIEPSDDGSRVSYRLKLNVYRAEAAADGGLGALVGTVEPVVQVIAPDQVRKVVPAALALPGEELRVSYRGVEGDGSYSVEAVVYPLVDLVWIGTILLMLGSVAALFGRPALGARHSQRAAEVSEAAPDGKEKPARKRGFRKKSAAEAEPAAAPLPAEQAALPAAAVAASEAAAVAAPVSEALKAQEQPVSPASQPAAPAAAPAPAPAETQARAAAPDSAQAQAQAQAAPSVPIAVPIEPIRPDYSPQGMDLATAAAPEPAAQPEGALKIEPISGAWEGDGGKPGFWTGRPGVLFGSSDEDSGTKRS